MRHAQHYALIWNNGKYSVGDASTIAKAYCKTKRLTLGLLRLNSGSKLVYSIKFNGQWRPQGTIDDTVRNSLEDYSSSSLIARAYFAGYFPSFTHQRLFHAIMKMLDGKDEGSIDFNELLTEAQMHRSSALQIIRHMVNFDILEVSFNSSHVIGEDKKSWAHIKLLRNLEAQELLPKSA